MALMNGSGDVRQRASRMFDEAAAQIRSGQLSGEGVEAAASQIESVISPTDNEEVSLEVRSTAEALRELPSFLEMERRSGTAGGSDLVGEAEAITDWSWGRDVAAEDRLRRAQDAYQRLNALPRGDREEEFAISEMINELAERIQMMGGEAR